MASLSTEGTRDGVYKALCSHRGEWGMVYTDKESYCFLPTSHTKSFRKIQTDPYLPSISSGVHPNLPPTPSLNPNSTSSFWKDQFHLTSFITMVLLSCILIFWLLSSWCKVGKSRKHALCTVILREGRRWFHIYLRDFPYKFDCWAYDAGLSNQNLEYLNQSDWYNGGLLDWTVLCKGL